MSASFSDHLRAESARYAARHANPRVAWDCLSAETWAKHTARWAAECEGMTNEQGVAFLTSIRDGVRHPETGMGFMVGLDVWKQIGILIDPFDKNPEGFIVKRRPNRPFEEIYVRYIGLNADRGYLRKGKAIPNKGPFAWDDHEDKSAWAARKAAWFARYDPYIPVTDDHHVRDFEFFSILGRAGDFAKGAVR